MSLAQEARERLLSDDERHSGFAITVCAGCSEPAYENPENPDGAGDINHKSGCRIVLLERVVAALEAAERVVCMPAGSTDIEAEEAIDALGAALLFNEVTA